MAYKAIQQYGFADNIIVFKSVSDILLVGRNILEDLEINILYTTAAWGQFCDIKFFHLATEIECAMVFCSIDNARNIFPNQEVAWTPITQQPTLAKVQKLLYLLLQHFELISA